MAHQVLFITPPFTQLNTPYPATAYLKGFLNTLSIKSNQVDLGIEVILELFSKKGLTQVFNSMDVHNLSMNGQRIFSLKDDYQSTIESVISFLQDRNPTLAYLISEGDYLPESGRFEQLDDLEWAFGTLGIRDKARYLSTLYLEDIGDFITEAIDPHFGFSRYAERLAMSATSFDDLYDSLIQPNGIIDDILIELLDTKIKQYQPTSVGITVPFPGNLYGAFKCAQYMKDHYPEINLWMGGGYANTELRSLKDPRVFEFVDYVLLDDGEAPIKMLLEHLEGRREIEQLKRTFAKESDRVIFFNGSKEKDIPQKEAGTPEYSDLKINKYLSVIEIANPMHRLWSDGYWNKLTLAHGCYWGKCTFCDISLDYIGRYEPINASIICDRIETIINQTGQTGFHFVDEAAPPALMRDLAIEILKRKLTVVWWTNIRFEQSFTADLCRLLRASGCIAVSGGLEVASDRLLALIKKGVTVSQVARVAHHFTDAGIMVHAYLMYGFPTQSAQETIDSLEMVRQMFMLGIIQSGYWHRFAMTAHSPVGINPEAFGVLKTGPPEGDFANNDLHHDDPDGADHDLYGEGLRKSLFNYMHGVCFELPLKSWFDHNVPVTSIPPKYIEREIRDESVVKIQDKSRIIWIGSQPEFNSMNDADRVELIIRNKKEEVILELSKGWGNLLSWLLKEVSVNQQLKSFKELKEMREFSEYEFETFINNEAWEVIREQGLLIL